MKKLSDTLQQLITNNSFLTFGFQHRLFNLTQLAHYLQPIVESEAQKPASTSAITMALSRLQRQQPNLQSQHPTYRIENLSIHSGLATLTYYRTPEVMQGIEVLSEHMRKQQAFHSVTQGMREATLIMESTWFPIAKQKLGQHPRFEHIPIASVGVEFGQRYQYVPGLLHTVLQRVAMQNINIIEVSSTFSEIVVYVDEADVRRVFDTLYQCFVH